MADDKEGVPPDPWADLEADGDGNVGDAFDFSFEDGESIESPTSDEPPLVEPDEVPQEAFDTDGSDAIDSSEVVSHAADAVDADGVFAETLASEPGAELIADDWLAPAAEGGAADEPFETAFGDALEDAAAPAAVIPSAVIPRVAPSPIQRKMTGGGAMGAVIGGLLSIPIVFFILLGVFWATGRDPLGFRSWLPRFMLPSGAGAAVREVAAPRVEPLGSRPSLDQVAIGESGADEQPSIDEPAEEDPAAIDASDMDEDSATEEFAASEKSTEAIIDDLPAAVPMLDEVGGAAVDGAPLASLDPLPIEPVVEPEPPAPAAPPEAPPLDLSGLQAAVDAATASLGAVVQAEGAEPAERRRLLVAWYNDLASVGEQFAMLETMAADSGRPLEETPAVVAELYGMISENDAIDADLERLCRNWIDFARRRSDGVMLVGQFDSTRHVGPYWHTTIAIEQADGRLRPVAVISRRQPRAEPGDRVAVAGVVFSGDMVWAADCSRLEAPVPAAFDD